ncbi:hypothetical protein ATCC90586_003339 [Pythium insidiosum]|nr:hypothetical protein ATCC90586_003339 [Pythium insidiosum]
MNGIVLLDEEQQRALYTHRAGSSGSDGDRPLRQQSPPRPQYRRGVTSGEPRTDFTTRAEPRTDFTSREEPRTDFTTRSEPRTDFTTRAEPRTDFTTRAEPRTDFRQNGSPRTNFTTSTNPRGDTILTAGSAEPFYTTNYPMLRRHSGASSTDETDQDDAPINRYAGASSGLKTSIPLTLLGVFVGIVLGIVLGRLEVSPLAAKWLSLPGDLFLRALKCLAVPYIFCAVAVAIGDIVFVGKVSIVGLQTVKVFIIFWLSSSVLGIAMSLLFQPLFRLGRTFAPKPLNAMGLVCGNDQMIEVHANGSIACTASSMTASLAPNASFVFYDTHDEFIKTARVGFADMSLSEQLQDMITSIVSNNIMGSLARSELLGIITFSMLLGTFAGRGYFTKTRRINYLYLVLLQSRNALFLALEWIIWLTPVAVVSIIGGVFAANRDAFDEFGSIYIYVVAAVAAATTQLMLVMPAVVFLLTRTNPYNHMRQMVQSYIFSFACSSSLATTPITLTCVKKARVCSQSLANFVISLGVTSNVSAMGFYAPVAITFLAESSGKGDELTALRYVGVFVLSLLACSGTPPIPAAGVVTVSTIYQTLFGVSEMPPSFAYVVALDFFVDRICSVCNVNDDIMALKVIAENTDETVVQEQLGERF